MKSITLLLEYDPETGKSGAIFHMVPGQNDDQQSFEIIKTAFVNRAKVFSISTSWQDFYRRAALPDPMGNMPYNFPGELRKKKEVNKKIRPAGYTSLNKLMREILKRKDKKFLDKNKAKLTPVQYKYLLEKINDKNTKS